MGSFELPPVTLVPPQILLFRILDTLNGIIMTLTIHDIIGCSSLGFFCRVCKRSLQVSNVKTHLQRLHQPFFLTLTAKDFKEAITSIGSSAGNAAIEDSLIGPSHKGVVCSICNEFFMTTRPAIFARHLANRQKKCPNAVARNVSYRFTACF